MKTNLADILPLLQSVADLEQSKLKKISVEIGSLRSEISQITNCQTAPYQQLNVQKNWEKWVANERARLNQRLALALSEHEVQKQILGRSVGRTDVLRKILGQDQ